MTASMRRKMTRAISNKNSSNKEKISLELCDTDPLMNDDNNDKYYDGKHCEIVNGMGGLKSIGVRQWPGKFGAE